MKLWLVTILLLTFSFSKTVTINDELMNKMKHVVVSINVMQSQPTDDKKIHLYFQLYSLANQLDQPTLKKAFKAGDDIGLQIIMDVNYHDDRFVNLDYIKMINHLEEIDDESMEWLAEILFDVVACYPKESLRTNKKQALIEIKNAILTFEDNYDSAKARFKGKKFDFKRNGNMLIDEKTSNFFIYLRSHYVTKEIDAIVDKHWSKWEIMFPELKNVPKTKRVPVDE